MMYLKVMGSDDVPDHDPSKPHTMLTVSTYSTGIGIEGGLFVSYCADGFSHCERVVSNIYVMNADGKTINTIAPARADVPQ